MNRFGRADPTFLVIGLIGAAVIIAVLALMLLDTTGEQGSGLGPEYDYEVEGLGKIDPSLILYEETGGAIATGFEKARAIAIDSKGNMALAGDRGVRVLNPRGAALHSFDFSAEPRCLAVAEDGTIYVGLQDHVEVYNPQGKRKAVWESLGGSAQLTSIAAWKEHLFVADYGNRVVIRYDTSGNRICDLGKKDPSRNVPGLIIPSPYFDIAVGHDGLLRVANTGRRRIEAYTFDGDLEFWWGESSTGVEGFCGCCNPANFAILGDESFVTCEKGIIRVKIYDGDGNFKGVVAGPEHLAKDRDPRVCESPEDCQAGGFDVAVDGNGRVFVLDTFNQVVRIFTRKGEE